MKRLLLLMLLYATATSAQTPLTFNKHFVESEDKWVAFEPDSVGKYSFAFVYIDEEAGLTMQAGGYFKMGNEGKLVRILSVFDTTSVKYRLEPDSRLVAFIPNEGIKQLGLQPTPDWLKNYKTDTGTVKQLYRWGYLYNTWDMCEKALTYLERARQKNPNFPGLKLELAFAYNTLEQYDKTISVLENAIGDIPDKCYLYKEYAYAQMHLGQLDKASQTCKTGISNCNDKLMNTEMAYNMTYQYYAIKDKTNFEYWLKEAKRWSTEGDKFSGSLEKMEAAAQKW